MEHDINEDHPSPTNCMLVIVIHHRKCISILKNKEAIIIQKQKVYCKLIVKFIQNENSIYNNKYRQIYTE